MKKNEKNRRPTEVYNFGKELLKERRKEKELLKKALTKRKKNKRA